LQSHGFQEAEDHGHQLTTPVASGTPTHLAVHYYWAQSPFRIIIIGFDFGIYFARLQLAFFTQGQ
jgi:hypothetical protein